MVREIKEKTNMIRIPVSTGEAVSKNNQIAFEKRYSGENLTKRETRLANIRRINKVLWIDSLSYCNGDDTSLKLKHPLSDGIYRNNCNPLDDDYSFNMVSSERQVHAEKFRIEFKSIINGIIKDIEETRMPKQKQRMQALELAHRIDLKERLFEFQRESSCLPNPLL
jgi:hypothetical protein